MSIIILIIRHSYFRRIHLLHDRSEHRRRHQRRVLRPLFAPVPRPVLVIRDPPDQHVAILPVAVDTFHHGVELRVEAGDQMAGRELLAQLVVEGNLAAGRNRPEVDHRLSVRSGK